jgi:MFS superfamily sulfate permease-like transporter
MYRRPPLLALVPSSLRGYRTSWLAADVVAGFTLVAIAVPEQMATARLVGMPAVVGLDAFVVGSLLFALFGQHRQMSVGADSTIAPILAVAPREATEWHARSGRRCGVFRRVLGVHRQGDHA